MNEEVYSAGVDFEPDLGRDSSESIAIFKNIITDLLKVKSNNLFSQDELLALSILDELDSTIEFQRLLKNGDIAEELLSDLYDKLSLPDEENDNKEKINLDEIFRKILALNPLRTEVSYL